MTIRLQHDGEAPGELCERCCFCRVPTHMWTALAGRRPGEQVACCETCAGRYRVKDVPSKRYWCEKEDTVTVALRGLTMCEEREPVRPHVQATLNARHAIDNRRGRTR